MAGNTAVFKVSHMLGARVFLVSLISLMPFAGLAAQGWMGVASLPSPREHHGSCHVNGQMYVFGGATEHLPEGMLVTQTNRYDPASDSWSVLGALPGDGGKADAVGNRCFIFGGFRSENVNRVFIYNANSDSWSQGANSPVPHTGSMTAVLDGKIYVANGVSPGGQSNMHVYDTAANSWRALAPMPTARVVGAATEAAGRLYFMGGAATEQAPAYNIVEVYDPASDSWSEASPMPERLRYHTACEAEGRIWVAGGILGHGAVSDRVFVYDPQSDSWAEGPTMPGVRNRHSCEYVGEHLYLAGGAIRTNGYPRGTMNLVIAYPVDEFSGNDTFPFSAGHNGNWWNGPGRNGEGVQVELSDGGNGVIVFVATIYSYDSQGNQIFLVAVGQVEEDLATVDVFITDGGQWGAGFDPVQVQEIPWGTGTFMSTSCDSIAMSLTPNSNMQSQGFSDLAYELVRLTTPIIPCS